MRIAVKLYQFRTDYVIVTRCYRSAAERPVYLKRTWINYSTREVEEKAGSRGEATATKGSAPKYRNTVTVSLTSAR